MRTLYYLILSLLIGTVCFAQEHSIQAENVAIWPNFAPNETSSETGTPLAPRGNASPPITRIENIRKPTLDVFPAENPNGAGVLILPGGGFGYVVPDMEGSEAAVILNRLGIAAFVLRYRTKKENDVAPWRQALQDSQRSLKYLRANADRWKLEKDKIGLLGFSAGGQVAARLLTDGGTLAYEAIDDVDQLSHRPDFSLLVYPWNMYDAATDSLLPEIKVNDTLPPTFIVHTNDDRSSSLGSALLYVDLKKAGVDAELHIYRNGGHGYGTRPRPDSNIGTWPDRMVDWLSKRNLATDH